jgi:hypothetical protein
VPDITMCDSAVCSVRHNCVRHEASGTKPYLFLQSWFVPAPLYGGEKCDFYYEKEEV